MDGDLSFGLRGKNEAWSCSQHWIVIRRWLSSTFAVGSMFREFAGEFRHLVPFGIAPRVV